MKTTGRRLLYVLAAAVLCCAFWPLSSCRDEFHSMHSGKTVLGFSQDTVRFDTLLTTHAAATQRLVVRNPYKDAVCIQRIFLASGAASLFRINVNGDTSFVQTDVILRGRDSIYIFINTFIDFRNSAAPFEVTDYLCFDIKDNGVQKVVLSAWGQDANYWRSDKRTRVPFHDPGIFNPDADSVTVSYFMYRPEIHTFSDPKPYVISGYLTVQEGQTLVIPAGTRIYFSSRSGIWVQKGARLKIEGSLAAPVQITGERQDFDYKNAAGQWGRIWLDAESGPHEVDYAYIRNGQTGFWLDSCVAGGAPGAGGGLTLRNTRIENMSSYAVFSRQNRVTGENLCCVQSGSVLGLFEGGDYEFTHCTFHNASSYGYGGSRCLWLSDYNTSAGAAPSAAKPYRLEKARFANCIFSGYNSQQLYIDLAEGAAKYPQIKFDYCLVTLYPEERDNVWFDSCVWNEDPLYADEENYDFWIDSISSPVVKRGNPAYVRGNTSTDISGKAREVPPTLGAYEFSEGASGLRDN